MIGNLLYMAVLMSPEISELAGEATGNLVESFGQKLASGICNEITNRVENTSGQAGALFAGIINSQIQNISESIKSSVDNVLSSEKMVLIKAEELQLLQEVIIAVKK